MKIYIYLFRIDKVFFMLEEHKNFDGRLEKIVIIKSVIQSFRYLQKIFAVSTS